MTIRISELTNKIKSFTLKTSSMSSNPNSPEIIPENNELEINVDIFLKYILDYDYYDSLTSSVISNSLDFNDELNKIRGNSRKNMAKLFEGTELHDKKGQLLIGKKLENIIRERLESFSKKEIEDYLSLLKKDTQEIGKLYKEVSKI